MWINSLLIFPSLRQIRYPGFEYFILLLKTKVLLFNDCGFWYVKKLAWDAWWRILTKSSIKPFENFDTKGKK